MRKRKLFRVLLCCVLLVSMLFSLTACGERGSNSGRSSGRGSRGEQTTAKSTEEQSGDNTASQSSVSAAPDDLTDDETLNAHKSANAEILVPAAPARTADSASFYLENTVPIQRFFSGSGAGGFQVGLRSVFGALNSLYSNDNITGYCLSSLDGNVDWNEVSLDDSSRQQMQTRSFYTYGDDSTNYLSKLFEGNANAFRSNELSVVVSAFAEPGFDLSGLSVALDQYMRDNTESAVCVYSALSHVSSTDLEIYRFNKNQGESDFTILEFDGDMPYYIVAVGPETSVQEFDNALSELLTASSISYNRGIFSNMVYAQLEVEPLKMVMAPKFTDTKSTENLLECYNTGNQSEDADGNIFYGTYAGIETKDDRNSTANLSYTSQLACISKNLNAQDGKYYTADFTLYTYDTTTKTWTPCDKLTSSYVTLECYPLKGSSEGASAILSQNDEQLYIAAKLDYSDNTLQRTTMYRVEVRLKLNYDNPNPQSENRTSTIWDSCISDIDYYSALEGLLTSTGFNKSYIKTWKYSQSLTDIIEPASDALTRTPNLESLLIALQGAEKYAPAVDDKIEYIDFIFNVNDGTTR